jgi:hypothetical protein
MGQTLAISLLLIHADLGQHGSEPLVGHDGARLDAGLLVLADRTVGVVGALGLASEPLVLVDPELGEVRVAGLGRGDSGFFVASEAVTRKMLALSL